MYPLTEAFNARNKLLIYIILVPDKDLISNIPSFRTSLTMGECINAMLHKMNMLVERRHQDLGDKRLGSLAPDHHPNIIWIRMLKRPFIEGETAAKIFLLQGKFNSAIEDQLRF